jgi:hypothetical protein
MVTGESCLVSGSGLSKAGKAVLTAVSWTVCSVSSVSGEGVLEMGSGRLKAGKAASSTAESSIEIVGSGGWGRAGVGAADIDEVRTRSRET